MNYDAKSIKEFWEKNPCGSQFIDEVIWKDFFLDYDKFKYSVEPHILTELSKIDFKNKKVLEIGLGQGSEAQKIVEAGAYYSGIDLTEESIKRVKKRFSLYGLKYDQLCVMNAEKMDFHDNQFDIIFSHGVIHHSPKIRDIASEIHRLLKPKGELYIMLYHKNSINYLFNIKILRRIGIFLLFIPYINKLVSKLTKEPLERINKHKKYFKEFGLNYLKMKNFIHKSTDGPDNVYSSVWSIKESKKLFSKFNNLRFNIYFLNERHLPIINKFLSKKFKEKIASEAGWHLWIKGVK